MRFGGRRVLFGVVGVGGMERCLDWSVGGTWGVDVNRLALCEHARWAAMRVTMREDRGESTNTTAFSTKALHPYFALVLLRGDGFTSTSSGSGSGSGSGATSGTGSGSTAASTTGSRAGTLSTAIASS